MRVNEVFNSIQGEGFWTGLPCTFIRLQGCNLRCPWCDTEKALGAGGFEMSVDEIREDIMRRTPPAVVFTGGEPLIQADEIKQLFDQRGFLNKFFHIETNGTLPLVGAWDWITVSPKPPEYKIVPEMFNELKIVVLGTEEIKLAEELAVKYPFAHIALQPCSNGSATTQLIIEHLHEKGLEHRRRWMLSVQVHKLIKVK